MNNTAPNKYSRKMEKKIKCTHIVNLHTSSIFRQYNIITKTEYKL